MTNQVTYRFRRYRISWGSVEKVPLRIKVWRAGSLPATGRGFNGTTPTWRIFWVAPRSMGPTARAVVALANKQDTL